MKNNILLKTVTALVLALCLSINVGAANIRGGIESACVPGMGQFDAGKKAGAPMSWYSLNWQTL